MRTLKILILCAGFIAFVSSGFAYQIGKGYMPDPFLTMGDITSFPKGHVATTTYSPQFIIYRDKQGQPWFQSTLMPGYVRTETAQEAVPAADDAHIMKAQDMRIIMS